MKVKSLLLSFLLMCGASAVSAQDKPQDQILPDTLCGADDRVASDDRRIGRINVRNQRGNTSNPFCTVWLISNGALLTAGHCVDDNADGVIDAGLNNLFVEFNVPASTNAGVTNFANERDQYPINVGSIRFRYDGERISFGRDWAIFRCDPNPNTGLTPHQAQGAFFSLTNNAPASGANIRVTGYGMDAGTAQNQTLQTSTGAYQGETQNGTGADFFHSYRVDTEGNNSGSPIIWENTGLAIGIHTNGGCTKDDGTGNRGTSFEHDQLERAMQNIPGANTVYVDRGYWMNAADTIRRDGNIFRPYAFLADGIGAAVRGGIVGIVAGDYNDRFIIVKPVTLVAPAGAVTIGR